MKVLIAHFTTESNSNIPTKTNINDYSLYFGEDVIEQMEIKDIFEDEQIELIPTIYANSGGSGVIKQNAFNYIESVILNSIKEHINEIDGIYLFLHGASYVENIGSGDHHILKEVRKIVGPYLPIAVVCDPHGNLTKEYVENCTIIRSFRESPHTDSTATKKLVAKMLCDLLKNRQNIHALYRKLPLILGGEQSVSTDEPVLSINKYMDEMEKDSRVRSVSWHVGYLRHDCFEAGCGIVIVPQTNEDIEYCKQKLDELANYIWNKRQEFHYTCLAMPFAEAWQSALSQENKPVVISDSGDNVTSGACGWNTWILREILKSNIENKKILISNICDPTTFNLIYSLAIGTNTTINLGTNYDYLSKSIPLEVTILAKGTLEYYLDHHADYGYCVLVKVKNKEIYINIGNTKQTMAEKQQFEHANINWDDYDIIIVKQGYIFPELVEKASLAIMALTDGATIQDTKNIKYRQIMRPMYPIDNI